MVERYVVCLPPARAQLNSLDNSLSEKLEKKIRRFIDAFDVRSVFRKEEMRSHLQQVGHRGDGTRALCTHWKGEYSEILLVFVAYKKTNEGSILPKLNKYNERAREYHKMFDSTSKEAFYEWLEGRKDDAAYLVFPRNNRRF